MRSYGDTGPSLQMKHGPNWQWPQKPTAHFMFRSIERWMRASGTPARASSRTVKRIITSGPQMNAHVAPGSRPPRRAAR